MVQIENAAVQSGREDASGALATTKEVDSTSNELRAKGVIRVILTRNIGRRAFLQSDNVNKLLSALPQDVSDEQFEKALADGRKKDEESAAAAYSEFQRLRGTPAFADAIRDLEGKISQSDHFELDKAVVETKKAAYEMDVLSQYLLEYELMPVYRFKENEQKIGESYRPQVQIPEEARWRLQNLGLSDDGIENILNPSNEALATEWSKWPYKKIMLSRYGLYQIILERNLDEPTPITSILNHVVGLEQKLDITPRIIEEIDKASADAAKRQPVVTAEELERKVALFERAGHQARQQLKTKQIVETSLDHSVQWELVGELIRRFLATFDGQIESIEESGHSYILELKERAQKAITKGTSYNLRSRYVIFEMHELFRGNTNAPINEDDLHEEEMCDLACLLEGVLLTDMAGKRKALAPIKSLSKRDGPTDVSTWKGELCWFSSDNAIIRLRYQAETIYLRFSNSGSVAYEKYWEGTIQAIAYITELRAVAKLLESDTSDDLEELARYMKDLRLGPDKATETFMRYIAAKISNASRLVARVRNASMPTTIGAPDYAVVKYRELIWVFDLERILRHTDRNIGLLHDFQEHYDDVQLQLDSVTLQQEQRTTGIANSILGAVLAALTFVLALLTIPVFVGELEDGQGAAEWVKSFGIDWLTPYNVRDYVIFFTLMLLVGVMWALFVSVYVGARTWIKRNKAKEAMEARIQPPSNK